MNMPELRVEQNSNGSYGTIHLPIISNDDSKLDVSGHFPVKFWISMNRLEFTLNGIVFDCYLSNADCCQLADIFSRMERT
jgi:hypothetical protein